MAWPLLSLVACGAVHRNHRSARLVANLEPTAGSAASAPAERWVAAYASLPAPVTRAWHGLLASEGRVHLLSGATAAAVSNSIVAPLDLIRLNMMVAKTQVSAMTMARRIFAENGVPGLWRGNSADVARAMPASAIRFYSFALAKANLPTLLPIALATPVAISLLSGGFAGMCAMTVCFPLESVRTRMAQLSDRDTAGLVGYTVRIVRTEGVPSLFRGITPSLVSVMPYFAMRFGIYDILKRQQERRSEGPPSAGATAACGMLAGLIASATTFPMEVVRRRAMVGSGERNPFVAMARIARQEGVRQGLYKGYGINIVKVAPSAGITFHTYEATRRTLLASRADAAAALRRQQQIAGPRTSRRELQSTGGAAEASR